MIQLDETHLETSSGRVSFGWRKRSSRFIVVRAKEKVYWVLPTTMDTRFRKGRMTPLIKWSLPKWVVQVRVRKFISFYPPQSPQRPRIVFFLTLPTPSQSQPFPPPSLLSFSFVTSLLTFLTYFDDYLNTLLS